jgi:type I restriction enzyme S subunit
MSATPKGWVQAKLSDIAIVIRGITFPASAKEYTKTTKNICCLRTSNVQQKVEWDNIYYVPHDYIKKTAQLVQDGDILISMANSYELVGKVALVESPPQVAAFGAFIAAVRPTAIASSQYLFHTLRSSRVQAALRAGSSQTTNIANISVGTLNEVPVGLPPIAEQQRIAKQLDTVLARVDACRDRLARVVPLLKRFRQSVLAAATSGRLTEEWRGGTESDWSRMRADEVCSKVQSGGTPKSGFTETTGVPFLKVYNIVSARPNCKNPIQINRLDVKFRIEESSL